MDKDFYIQVFVIDRELAENHQSALEDKMLQIVRHKIKRGEGISCESLTKSPELTMYLRAVSVELHKKASETFNKFHKDKKIRKEMKLTIEVLFCTKCGWESEDIAGENSAICPKCRILSVRRVKRTKIV